MKKINVLIILFLLIIIGIIGYNNKILYTIRQNLVTENESLKRNISKLHEENNNLKLSIKEWEGFIPNAQIGEFWVEGTVISLDTNKRSLTIEQYLDPDSIIVNPKIYILPHSPIQEVVADVSDGYKVRAVYNRSGPIEQYIKVGDTVSLVYRQADKAAKLIKLERLMGD